MLMDAFFDDNDFSNECGVTRMMLVVIISNKLAITITISAIEIIMITVIKTIIIIDIGWHETFCSRTIRI